MGNHEERTGVLCTAGSVEEAMPPLLEIQHGSLLPTDAPRAQKPAFLRGVDIQEGAIWDVLCHPHSTLMSKAQNGLPRFEGLKVLGWPRSFIACSGQSPLTDRWWHRLVEVKHGGTSPRQTLGHGGTLGSSSAR